MKIAVACDHGGFTLKQAVLSYLNENQYETRDFGCFDTSSVDYADYAFPACEAVVNGEADRAVVICTTGIGMCISANKVRGIRCALCCNVYMAEMTRRHNDTNALALGANVVDTDTALAILSTWLTTEFEGGRHARRIGKIAAYENER